MRPRWLCALLIVAAGCGGEDDRCDDPAPGVVCTLAGTGEYAFNRDGLTPEKTHLYLPSAARRAPGGRLFVMDFNNQRLRYIDAQNHVQTAVGNGFHALAATDVPAADSPLENPIDFAFLPDGRLIFTSYHDPRVLILEPEGTLSVAAGTENVGARGFEGDFGPALEAQFIQLDGIAVAPDGTFFVSDSLANRVRMIRDGEITTYAGTGTDGYGGDGGPAVDADLNWPTALELLPDGSLLIADANNHAIRKVDPSGNIATIAGTGAAGYGGDGGPATAASLNRPMGLAVAADGSLYVGDRDNFRIRKIGPDGIIDTIAGSGVEGLSGDGGPATEAAFGYIARVAIDSEQLLIADQSNACIRVLVL